MVEKLTSGKKNRFIGAIMIDIDRFKSINDELGHSVGDDAIRSIGKLLSTVSASNTIPFRIGGDEFIVLHIDGGQEDIEALRKTINEQLLEFNETSEKPYKLSVSMGVSTCNTDGTSLDSFFHQLDRKMYEQKSLREMKNN